MSTEEIEEVAEGEHEEGEEIEEEEEEVAEEEEDADAKPEEGATQATAGADVNVNSFEELRLDPTVVSDAQEAWRTFINSAASREAAGEAIYAALFDAAPSLQSLFLTPRAIQSMKFMNGLNTFIMSLSDPPQLKIAVETLGFGHLALDVTVPRVVIFRDAILDLFQVELGSRLTTAAYNGWRALLNYVGGAIIYIKAFYADRIRLLGESWTAANDKGANKDKFATMQSQEQADLDKKKEGKDAEHAGGENTQKKEKEGSSMVQNVPTTFKEMFQFNAAVMGFGQSMWMNEVLACFDNIVSNVSNSNRLIEECDILVCRIARVATGKVNLAEFKSCMLASLRSLLPKDWTTAHEVAWSWLWENVERMLLQNMGQPPLWEKAYSKLLDSIDEATGFQLRKDIYLKFFALAPAGQDYFKQSNTYLHLVATKVLIMVIDIYKDPVRMVDDISALGLRHVGYAIPTEYMPPFASACVEVVQGLTKDQVCIEGFQWSIGLIAKSLVRTILEGSTIVMKSINVNTKKSMNKAISVAPRGERANWMLLITVGTQSISPLAWSIESGATQSASAVIKDLLTFRADRDRYYYGVDELFGRHHDIVKMLCDEAPGLLPELLSGLVWRSRLTQNGMRRVNYYIKHLLVGPDGNFAKTLEWVVKTKDPRLVCHPVNVLLTDIVWSRVASRAFLFRKTWFLFTLAMFILSQSILQNINRGEHGEDQRIAVFACRIFIYVFSMGQLVVVHTGKIFKCIRNGDTMKLFNKIPIPAYLENWQDQASMGLTMALIAMVASEPVLRCLEASDTNEAGEKLLFTQECDQAQNLRFFPYSFFAMIAMFLYYCLLLDMVVFSTRISSYSLACGRMLAEVGLFLLALAATIITFASALSCLDQKEKEFHGIHLGALALFKMVMNMFNTADYTRLHQEPIVMVGVYIFLIVSVVFFLNMLIAQLACSYGSTYQDMVGFARLGRIRLIVETMPTVSDGAYKKFVNSMSLQDRLEFNEGDVGIAGGIQVQEPASHNPTTIDQIKRFGGSTSPTISWPEEEGTGDDDSDKFDRLETLIKRTMERISKSKHGGGKRKTGASSSGMSGSGGAGESGANGSGMSGGEEKEASGDAEED